MNDNIVDNRGIPPLAGICAYEQAVNPGYTVEKNVSLLKRYNYVKKRLFQTMTAHVAGSPEWEVKCALSYHLWLETQHCASLRSRVSEMRQPPLHLDQVPDDRLQAWMDEVVRADSTLELLVGIYRVVKPELLRAVNKHMRETNPMMDQPTVRVLKFIALEEEEMIAWGEQAIAGLLQTAGEPGKTQAEQWQHHLLAYVRHAGGIAGDVPPGDAGLPKPRTDGRRYEMDATPRRDSRFSDHFNSSARIDGYFGDADRPMEERVYALMYKRLREMDVPEWIAPILYKTEDKPWEYYVDLSRQLWDEARHAMLGEIGLYQGGVPFYKYPVDIKASYTLNTMFAPEDAHLILWFIEQSLMPKTTGKQKEWEIARQSVNLLGASIQDYDWADEVLHAQIGRKWVVPQFGGLESAREIGQDKMQRWSAAMESVQTLSGQREWWSQFMTDIYAAKAGAYEEETQ